ncbi:LPS translocon maturation chaperone LptM [Mesosutterella faecium]|uniref:LPS translocon maturation chaperone LptM n=1 Tax=Mesosutterella faecium TaxID=2925194 RepID=UPI003BF51B76
MKNRFLRASIIVSLSCCALLTGCGLKSGLYMPAPAHRSSAAGSAQNPQARQAPGAAVRDQTSSDEHAASGAAAENK